MAELPAGGDGNPLTPAAAELSATTAGPPVVAALEDASQS